MNPFQLTENPKGIKGIVISNRKIQSGIVIAVMIVIIILSSFRFLRGYYEKGDTNPKWSKVGWRSNKLGSQFLTFWVFKISSSLQDGAPKIAKLPYRWFNYSLWYIELSGWWFQPLWKIWVRQLGWLFPIDGTMKFMFQTTNQYICITKFNHKPSSNHLNYTFTMFDA